MNRKWLSCFLIVCLLSSGLSQPLLSIAVSHQSEETTSSAPAPGELPTLSSEVLGAPTEIEPGTLEEVPEKEKSIQEYVAEETYEARDLSKEDPNNVSHPVVTVQITGQTLEGEIGLRSEPALTSKTILENLSLQAKGEETDWQEVKTFEKSKSQVLSDQLFSFEYRDLLEGHTYRIVVDYGIEESDEEQIIKRTLHKGHILLAQFEVSEKEASPEEIEESKEDSSTTTETSNTEMEIADSVPIGPRAVNDVVYNGQYYNKAYANVTISGIKSRQANIKYLRHKYQRPEYTQYAVWSTDPNRIKNLCANTSSVSNGIPEELWLQLKSEGNNVTTPWINNHTGSASMPSAYFGGVMTNLSPNTTYYVWLFEIYEIPISGYKPRAEFFHPQETSSVDSKGIYSPYVFKTDAAIALSLSAPTFTQANATHDSIPMVGKTYTGDIFQTNTQGKVQVTPDDGTTVQDKVTNLGHTKTQGGTYNSSSVTGLTAGTRYKGRVSIKDYGGTWRYSPWSGYFYTANTVNQPAVPTLNTPTAANNATATVSATYNVGNVAAHPTAAEVQVSTNNSSWSTLNTTSTPATTTPTINTGNKSVNFTLSKLNAKTKYYVRYRVRNASNVWSGYSTSREFTTNGVALTLTAPTFTQASATHNSIPMIGNTYTGDIFQTNTQGIVQITSNDGTTVQNWITNLGHTKTTGGKYDNATLGSLTAGTRYKARVAIKDYGGTLRYSPWSGYFYTANTVNQPAVPTLSTPTAANNAMAYVSATYNVGNVAAHPTSTDIQLSTDNSSWSTITADTTPAITNRVFDTNTKSVTFTLSKLNSKTKYYVRYRVRNASNVWSGFSTSREFTTKGVALSYISNPTFSYTSSAKKMILNEGTYSGDIYGGAANGQQGMHVKNDAGVWVSVRGGSLHHEIPYGSGKYAAGGYTLPDELMPGTQYRSHVFIRDTENVWQESWKLNNSTYSYFYTKNEVDGVTNISYTPAQTATDASASMVGVYKVSDYSQGQAHPKATGVTDGYDGQKGVDIQIRSSQDSNYTSWKSVKALGTIDSPITVTSLTINLTNKRIEFALGNMKANTTYEVQYRVKNDSNQWSEYSSAVSIRTYGVALQISPPVFDQTTATATSIQLKPGTYTGDISPTANQGVVFTESYNSGTNDKDWTARVNNLQHTTTTNGTYSAATVTGLTPGTRYKGWLQIKNAEEVFVGPVGQPSGAANEYFYTKNTVSSLSAPTLNTPVTENGATAEFSMDYQAAGDHPDQPAAHPSNVKIYLSTDGVSYSELTSSSGNPAVEEVTIDPSTKKASVKIKNLTAAQTYYVKCSVVNQGGESEQTPVRTFTTNQRPAGLYVSETPTFNFGVQSVSTNVTTAGLTDHQGTNDFGIRIENVGMNANWSFSARLSSLQTQDGSNRQLTGAQVSFNKELQRTTDGVNWQPVIQDFEGLTTPTTVLSADNSTQQLWKSTSVAAGQGKFRTTIEFDSVRLLLPGNVAQKGDYYEGKIEWLMINEP